MRAWFSGRTSPCQGEGHGFESHRPLKRNPSKEWGFLIPLHNPTFWGLLEGSKDTEGGQGYNSFYRFYMKLLPNGELDDEHTPRRLCFGGFGDRPSC